MASTTTRELEIIARFKDLASKSVARLGSNIGRMTRGAIGSMKGLAKAFGGTIVVLNQLTQLAGSLGRAFIALGRAAAIPIRAAIEQERVEKQLAAALRSTGGAAGLTADELTDMASALQSLTVFGDEAIIGMQNILLTFTQIKKSNGIFERTTEVVLDLSTAMGTDLKEQAIQVGKALNDPITGLSALSRVGITFSDQQKRVIKALAETGKVAEAQGLILDELQKQFGGSARAAVDTFGGQLQQLHNQWGDLLERIGQFITQNAGIKRIIEEISNAIGEWTKAIEQLAASSSLQMRVATIIKRAAVIIVQSVAAVVEGIAAAIDAFTGLVAAIDSLPGVSIGATAGQKALSEQIAQQEGILKRAGESWDDLFEAERRGTLDKTSAIALRREETEIMERTQRKLDALRDAYENAGFAGTNFAGDVSGVVASLLSLATRLDNTDLTGVFANAGRPLREIKPDIDATARSFTDWESAVLGLSDAIATMRRDLGEVRLVAAELGANFLGGAQDSIADFLTAISNGTRSLGEAFGDLIDSIRLQLADMLIQFAAGQIMRAGLAGLGSIPGLNGVLGGGDDAASASNTSALVANTMAIEGMTAALIPGGGVAPNLQPGTGTPAGPDQSFLMRTLEGIGSVMSFVGKIFASVGGWIIQGISALIQFVASSVASGVGSFLGGIFGFAGGGKVPQYLAGGGPSAARGTDTVPAMLTPGEFVMRRSAVDRVGLGFLNALNQGRVAGFAAGGAVGGSGGGPAVVNVSFHMQSVDTKGMKRLLAEEAGTITGIVEQAVATKPGFRRNLVSAVRRTK